MTLFGSIVGKIVSLAESAVGGGEAKAAAPAGSQPEGAVSGGGAAPASGSAAVGSAAKLASVDIGAVLTARAAEKGETLHWQTSIVDLLKVLDLDSSLAARKQLASELDVHAGADGSAEENEALHRAVVTALEKNGGTVPADMKS